MSRTKTIRAGSLALCVLVGVCIAGVAFAQSGWEAEWRAINDMYNLDADYDGAIDRLEQQLTQRGGNFSDAVLDQMLPMLKSYFETKNQPQRFKRMVSAILTADRLDKISNYFRESSLGSVVQSARAEWLKPASAQIALDATQLKVGESAGYRVTVRNARRAPVGAQGVRVVLSPQGIASISTSSRRITAQKPGTVTVKAVDSGGGTLGTATLTVTQVNRPISARVEVDPPQLEIGQTATFKVTVLNQRNEPMDNIDVSYAITPANLGNIDVDKQTITAERAGRIALIVSGPDGAELGQATVEVLTEVGATIEPGFVQIPLNSSADFTIRSTRDFDGVGLEWALGAEAIADAVLVEKRATSRTVQVTPRKKGETSLIVTDSDGGELARATITIVAPQTTPEDLVGLRSGPKKPSLLYTIIGGVAAAGLGGLALKEKSDADSALDDAQALADAAANETDTTRFQQLRDEFNALIDDHNSATDRANIFGIGAGVAAAATAYFAWGYLQDRKAYNDHQAGRAPDSAPDRLGLSVGLRRMDVIVHF